MNRLAGLHPQDAVVQLNLGVALFWAGLPGAEDAWRAAAASEPDTAYAVVAGNLLHPDYAKGLPDLRHDDTAAECAGGPDSRRNSSSCSAAAPSEASRESCCTASRCSGSACSARRSESSCRRRARRPETPRRRWRRPWAASTRHGRRRRSRGSGPLTRRFPDRATVRFHLGLLLLWSGEVKEARTQLVRATTVEPGSAARPRGPPVPRRAGQGGCLSRCEFLTDRGLRGYRVEARDGRGGPERSSKRSGTDGDGTGCRPDH